MRISQASGHRRYGGVANVQGQHCGWQGFLQHENQGELYAHGLARILNLVLEGMIEKVETCKFFMGTLSESINLVMCFGKCLYLF